jgi:hypothetical protein
MSEEPPEALILPDPYPTNSTEANEVSGVADPTVVSRRLRLRATEGCGDNREDRSCALNGWRTQSICLDLNFW